MDELTALDEVLGEIKHSIIIANKQIGKEEALNNKELGRKIIDELNSQKGFDKNLLSRALTFIKAYTLNPERIGRMISNYDEDSQFYQLFKELWGFHIQ